MNKKIIISGASGLVGKLLLVALKQSGYDVYSLVRQPARAEKQIYWDPYQNEIDVSSLEDAFAFINLSGDNIASGRWTPEKKHTILKSRVKTTEVLVEAICHLKNKPKVFLNASATGFYGDRADEVLDESSRMGRGFLSDVCVQWENAAMRLSGLGVRTCLMRFGILLSKEGGALLKMLLPFKLGLGGLLGNGTQYMSWMSLDDVILGILFLLESESINGPVNFVSPTPVTNADFSKTLAAVLKRPCIMSVPKFVLKMMMGEMAESLLLASTKVVPQKLIQSGFNFKYPELHQSLRAILL